MFAFLSSRIFYLHHVATWLNHIMVEIIISFVIVQCWSYSFFSLAIDEIRFPLSVWKIFVDCFWHLAKQMNSLDSSSLRFHIKAVVGNVEVLFRARQSRPMSAFVFSRYRAV